MKTKIPLLLFAFIYCSQAAAQSNPGLSYGFVPTPAQWNSYLSQKQDVLNFVPLNVAGGVMTGRLVAAAPSAAVAGFNLTPGSTPASPVNGDLWVTSAGLFGQVNGATVGPFTSAATPCTNCALTTNPLSQFAATTSAQLRGVLSDESGTGAALFQNGALGTPTATSLALGGAALGSNALSSLGIIGVVSGSDTLASLLNASGNGRAQLCNDNLSGAPRCGSFSAYSNSAIPSHGTISVDLTGSDSDPTVPGFSSFQVSANSNVSRFEFWVTQNNTGLDDYMVCGTPGRDCYVATQWDAALNSGLGAPRDIHIGLGASSGIAPLVQGIVIAPFMSGGTVQYARVGIGTVGSPSGTLHVQSAETTSNSQVIFDGSASSNGSNVLMIGNGSTTPTKTTRVANGHFQILNDAYSAAIFDIADNGATTLSGPLVAANLGTPSAGVMTNVSGTAAGLTAGHVTTNANLTGDITSTGNASTYNNVVPATKGGAGTIAGALKGNGSGVVSQAACGDLSNATSACSAPYTSAGSWTPTDASGAGLTFTGVSAGWSQVGNMVFAYASLNYPTTVSGNSASIGGFPVNFPAAQYGRQCQKTFSTVSTLSALVPNTSSPNLSLLTGTGGAVPNSAMSATNLFLMCIYPAT